MFNARVASAAGAHGFARPKPARPPPVSPAADRTSPPLLVTGGILSVIGVLNLATAPVCLTGIVPLSVEDECVYAASGASRERAAR